MNNFSISAGIAVLLASTPVLAADQAEQAFFTNLSLLCGQQFVGEMTFPEDGQDSFAGKKLVASIDSCSESELRIPFVVGEDTSRTWVITLSDEGLQLKHDHRHDDGTPDEVTNYGGMANGKGTALMQAFPADAFTAELIPAASTNVWNLTVSEDRTELVYHLTRHDAPRFTAVLAAPTIDQEK